MAQNKKGPAVKEIPVSFVRRFQLSEKVCPVCGQKFMGTKKAQYDRVACRQKANYDRHASAYRQQKLEKYHADRKVAVGKK
jgi:hypothetical protein